MCSAYEDLRPIRVHCDEAMRAHLEFMTNRYLNEVRMIRQRVTSNLMQWDNEIRLTERCLEELKQAGT